jgi:glycosyltransferase involved in cell wall biosynthesis
MKIAVIVTDDRDTKNQADKSLPYSGPASTALMEGFAAAGKSVEVHLVAGVSRVLSSPKKLAENIFYHQVVIPRTYRRTFFWSAVWRIRKKIHEIDPDIVKGNGTEAFSALVAAFSGYPNCVEMMGNMRAVARQCNFRPFAYMLLTYIGEWVALRKTDGVICQSKYTEAQVRPLNSNIWIFNKGVRQSFFDIQRHQTSTPILLCAGTIVNYKNQLNLMLALDSVAREKDFELVFAGGLGAATEYNKAFLRAVDERSWCRYEGALSVEALQELLGEVAGLIHPSQEDSFGLAVAEAQAAGVPVAASAIGGLVDLIEHNRTGILFDPSSPREIADCARKLLDVDLNSSIGAAAREWAIRAYSPKSVALNHLKAYEEITGRSKAESSG